MDDRIIPKNIDIERYITGCLIQMTGADKEKYAMMLQQDDFTDPLCKKICAIIRDLIRRGINAELIEISEIDPDITVPVIEIMENVVTTSSIDSRMRRLKELTAQRNGIYRASHFLNLIYDSNNPIDDLSNFVKELDGIVSNADALLTPDFNKTRSVLIQDGVSSGFVTHDYNDSGLRDGCLTILLGSKNHGKTTYARQVLLASSMQNVLSFFFAGETSIHEEKRIFSKMNALPDELQPMDNLGGRTIWYPKKSAFDRFNDVHAGNIQIIDDSLHARGLLFDYLLREMQIAAEKGCKIFVLDSLSILATGEGAKRFHHQDVIIEALNKFKKRYDVHVILIVHPRKGKGWESSSGSANIENLADTIIRYIRMSNDLHQIETQNYKNKDKVLANVALPDPDKEKITAMMAVEKIRQGGSKFAMFFEWDEKAELMREISQLPKAEQYENAGLWVKYTSRYKYLPKPITEPLSSNNLPYKDAS